MTHSSCACLDNAIVAYLAHQRALGRWYQNEERHLKTLSRFVAAHAACDLTPELFSLWCNELERLHANTRRHRELIVYKFCRFRRRREPRCFVPDPLLFARAVPVRLPFIFGPAEIARLLAAADHLVPNGNSPLLPAVMRLAIILLYTAGLRRGELLRLTLADIAANAGVLHIRESKFHKSRWVPLSADAHHELKRYLRQRLNGSWDARPGTPLLCNCARGLRGYTGTGLRERLDTLFAIIGLVDAQGRRPRVHDFRHSFAIQALLRWYREGADLHSELPRLALYMGHVSIASTAYYLKLVPAVASLASERFERGFADLLREVRP